MRKNLFVFFCMLSVAATAQKKPLDHSVYDGWQSIGERSISNDGKYVVLGSSRVDLQACKLEYSIVSPK